MSSPAASISTSTTSSGEVSRGRLYVLRGTYLLLVVGLGVVNVPDLLHHDPTARGVIPSLLGGIWLVAMIGLRYPLQMLPLLLFEFAWKAIWLFDYGLPQWYAGTKPPTWSGDFTAIAAGVILMPLVIPIGYTYRTYLNRRGGRTGQTASRAPYCSRRPQADPGP